MENEPLLILLADDDEADRMLFTEAFSELLIKTKVVTFKDGEELMQWLNENKTHTPHVIFLDLNMPRKSGIDCLKEIRRNDLLKDIAIAIYSTTNSDKDVEETFLIGANIYIVKPNDFSTLKLSLEKAVMASYHYHKKDMKIENFLLKI